MPRAFKFGFAVAVLISIVVFLWLWQRDLSDASPTADSRVVQPNEHTGAEIPGLQSSVTPESRTIVIRRTYSPVGAQELRCRS